MKFGQTTAKEPETPRRRPRRRVWKYGHHFLNRPKISTPPPPPPLLVANRGQIDSRSRSQHLTSDTCYAHIGSTLIFLSVIDQDPLTTAFVLCWLCFGATLVLFELSSHKKEFQPNFIHTYPKYHKQFP